MGLTQLHGYFLYSISHLEAGATGSPKTDQCGLMANRAFQGSKSIAPSWVSLSQVPYFPSHMHECLGAQCQEKTYDRSQQDKILARKNFAREEEKLPFQTASKYTMSSNNPGTRLTFCLQKVQWTCSVRCFQFF